MLAKRSEDAKFDAPVKRSTEISTNNSVVPEPRRKLRELPSPEHPSYAREPACPRQMELNRNTVILWTRANIRFPASRRGALSFPLENVEQPLARERARSILRDFLESRRAAGKIEVCSRTRIGKPSDSLRAVPSVEAAFAG